MLNLMKKFFLLQQSAVLSTAEVLRSDVGQPAHLKNQLPGLLSCSLPRVWPALVAILGDARTWNPMSLEPHCLPTWVDSGECWLSARHAQPPGTP